MERRKKGRKTTRSNKKKNMTEGILGEEEKDGERKIGTVSCTIFDLLIFPDIFCVHFSVCLLYRTKSKKKKNNR